MSEISWSVQYQQEVEWIDKGNGGEGAGEWKEWELIHGKRLGEAKAPGRGEGCREEKEQGGEGHRETTWA